MTWSRSRVLVPLGVALSLSWGCVWSRRPAYPEPVRQPNEALTSGDVENAAPGQPIEQMLMDRFPGIEVLSRPGGGIAMRIRGPASFYGSSDPLLVVDGVTIDVGANNLSWLNPHDIATITVLKNPSETAIYGVRGANGVILVTTKRPGK